MRDRIGGIFASAGCFLWQVLTVIVVAFPLIVLKLPALVEWIMFAIAAVATNLFAFISLPLWIWGIVQMANGPQDVFAVVYYVLFVVVALPVILQICIQLCTRR